VIKDKQIRIAIAGFGAVARFHVKAYRNLPAVTIAGVVDVAAEQRLIAERDFGLPAYATIAELLRNTQVDIVCVLAPAAAHEQLVCECAAAHVHVLCEKPLALSTDSCELMIKACREHQVRLCYGASYRYLPALIVAHDIITSGKLGEVLILRESAIGGRGPQHRNTLSDAHYPLGGPGGSGMGLCDHGIHLIDTFAWLTGATVTRSWGRGNISGGPQGPEFLHLEYSSGAIGQLVYEDGTYSAELPQEGQFAWADGWSIETGDDAPRPGNWQAHPGCIYVHGTEGALRIFHYANLVYWRDARGVRQVPVPDRPFPANFAMQLASFAAAIRDGRATPVPGEAGLAACRTLLSAYREM
jgi:predicted dehydrogenase